jgi:hypothetical protein
MKVSGQFHTPAALPQGKSPRYPLDRRLSGPQSRSGRGSEEKNSQLLPGIELPIIQPIAQDNQQQGQDWKQTTALMWLVSGTAWGLSVGLTTPHSKKKKLVMEY